MLVRLPHKSKGAGSALLVKLGAPFVMPCSKDAASSKGWEEMKKWPPCVDEDVRYYSLMWPLYHIYGVCYVYYFLINIYGIMIISINLDYRKYGIG